MRRSLLVSVVSLSAAVCLGAPFVRAQAEDAAPAPGQASPARPVQAPASPTSPSPAPASPAPASPAPASPASSPAPVARPQVRAADAPAAQAAVPQPSAAQPSAVQPRRRAADPVPAPSLEVEADGQEVVAAPELAAAEGEAPGPMEGDEFEALAPAADVAAEVAAEPEEASESVADEAGQHEAGQQEAGHEGDHHQGHGAHGHVPHFGDINWFSGFLGEREGPPSLLFRPPGTPIPLGALILNTAILFYLIGRFGGPGIRKGLAQRKQRIAGDIEAAARMREDAAKQLEHYEQKLHHMSTELERIMKETREQAEAEHQKILAEAKVRRETLEEEARQIVAHELAHARQEAVAALVSRSVQNAATKISAALEERDQLRLSETLVSSVVAQLGKSEVRS